LEGEHADLRQVRRTIASIRDEFAAAARREHRPGTARLILPDPDRFATARAVPGLPEFDEMCGMTDFSEAEQLEAYEEAIRRRAGKGRAALSEVQKVSEALVTLRVAAASSNDNSRPSGGCRVWWRRTPSPLTVCQPGSILRWPRAWSGPVCRPWTN
jgi:hypothetical protein